MMVKYGIFIWCLLSLETLQIHASENQRTDIPIFCDERGTEYKFFTKGITPKNAIAVCRLFGGHLATIGSAEKIHFIRKKMEEYFLAQAVVGLCMNVGRGEIEHLNGTTLKDDIQKGLKLYHVISTPPYLVALRIQNNTSVTRGYLCQKQTDNASSFCGHKASVVTKATYPKFKLTTSVPPIKTEPKKAEKIPVTRSIKTLPIFSQLDLEIQKQEFLKHLDSHLSTILPHIKTSTSRQHKQPLAKRDTTVGLKNTTGNMTMNDTSVVNNKPMDVEALLQSAMYNDNYTNDNTLEESLKSKNDKEQVYSNANLTTTDLNLTDASASATRQKETEIKQDKIYDLTNFADSAELPTSSVSSVDSTTVDSRSTPFVKTTTHAVLDTIEAISEPQSLPSASELMDNISLAMEMSSNGKSHDSGSISSNELSTIVEDLLPMLAPHHVQGLPNDPGSQESKNSKESTDEEVSKYALSFMRITSNLLKSENTDAWKEVASSENSSYLDGLTPSFLLEQIDAVLDFSVKSFAKSSKQLIFDSDEFEVRLEHIDAKNVTQLDVNADGTIRFPNSSLSRRTRSLRSNATRNETLAVVTANYKSVPEILKACAEVSMQSLQDEKTSFRSNGTEENICSKKGFLVTDSLCKHMYPSSTSPPSGVWTFPQTSNVLSITAYQDSNIRQSIPVKFRIQEIETTPNNRSLISKCVYYDVDELLWSDQGCEMVSEAGGKFTCFCNHTTNFAIMLLVPIKREEMNGIDVYNEAPPDGLCGVALQMVSYVVGGFSIAFLIVSVAFFAYARQTSERTVERNTVHMCFALSMLCLHLVLLMDNSNLNINTLGGAPLESPGWFCYVITALTHFFLLCNFAWMSVEGILLYFLVVRGSKGIGKSKHVIGWFLPMLIAGVTLAVAKVSQVPYVRLPENGDQLSNTTLQNGDGAVCYLAKDLTWTAFVPVLISYVLNFAITLRLVAVIGRLTRESRKYMPAVQQGTQNQHNIQAVKKSFASFLKLNPLLGFPWILGFVASFVPQPYLCYLIFVHTCLNGLQGVIFFFVTVIENEESRSLIRLTWRKLRHNTNSFVSSLRPRKSLSYPVVALNNRPTGCSTPPSAKRQTVHTPILGGKEPHPRNIVVCNTSPGDHFHYV